MILEAKRLLAHGGQPASRIAAQLGFTSATDCSTYFHQRTGQSLITFRAAPLGRSAKNGPGDTPGTGRPGQ
ncbi:helix-turn-helix domain-containing protein [Streptomyces avermitilis]|uniref:helix-turn-helix domain-containing protein n=1 Tax=Streptomyces avermitilis TaxID=33903 RepID=UPI0033D4EE55